MTRNHWLGLLLFTALVGLGFVGRLLPHPPNFTPVVAIVLFAGFFFRNPAVCLCLVLAVMAVTDSVIGTYHFGVMVVVYAALMLPAGLRGVLRSRLSAVRVGSCAVLSQGAFFVATNFAVWFFGDLYPHTKTGLVECYVAALPFLRNALYGDLFWCTALFGSYVLVTSWFEVGARVAPSAPVSPMVN